MRLDLNFDLSTPEGWWKLIQTALGVGIILSCLYAFRGAAVPGSRNWLEWVLYAAPNVSSKVGEFLGDNADPLNPLGTSPNRNATQP